jgi:hypothetical protein
MATACPAGHRGFTYARDHLVQIDKQDKLILARLQTPTPCDTRRERPVPQAQVGFEGFRK